ncbi:hypothetical protein [Dickeya ananatis]|uniref:hypothetical protein n=1 Tax=Dickeya ananatis TaxID=3061286 RepID=UPI00388FAD26
MRRVKSVDQQLTRRPVNAQGIGIMPANHDGEDAPAFPRYPPLAYTSFIGPSPFSVSQ